jgi:hypothetical protein
VPLNQHNSCLYDIYLIKYPTNSHYFSVYAQKIDIEQGMWKKELGCDMMKLLKKAVERQML